MFCFRSRQVEIRSSPKMVLSRDKFSVHSCSWIFQNSICTDHSHGNNTSNAPALCRKAWRVIFWVLASYCRKAGTPLWAIEPAPLWELAPFRERLPGEVVFHDLRMEELHMFCISTRFSIVWGMFPATANSSLFITWFRTVGTVLFLYIREYENCSN